MVVVESTSDGESRGKGEDATVSGETGSVSGASGAAMIAESGETHGESVSCTTTIEEGGETPSRSAMGELGELTMARCSITPSRGKRARCCARSAVDPGFLGQGDG